MTARSALYVDDWPVIDSPALAVLLELQTAGVEVRVLNGVVQFRRHRDVLTDEQRMVLDAHANDVRELLRMLADSGLRSRVRRFAQMFDASTPTTLPTNVLTCGIPYATGVCFSCGHELPRSQYGRCWRCALAWRIAWRYPLHKALQIATDEARVA